MEIIRVSSNLEAGQLAGDRIIQAIENGAKVLGLATGSSPIPIYQYLIEKQPNTSHLTAVNLDEYVGLNPDHPQSYRYFMQKNLFDKLPFAETHIPDGSNLDAAAEVARYDAVLAAHPVDVQLLGLGVNGHIGFNEPGTPFDTTTHHVALTESTIEANKRFFESKEEVPRFAYTMGLASIMAAKEVILVAFGAEKADAIAGMVNGPVTEDLPASILQKHPRVTVYVDEAAASKL